MGPIERPDWGGAAVEESSAPMTMDVADADDDSALHRKLLVEALFTPDELALHYGLSREELDALSVPLPPSRVAVEAELAETERQRRQDRRTYFRDEAMQTRERELIELRAKLRAQTAAPMRELDGEGVSGLAPELLAEWENAGGVEYHLATAQRTAQAALNALEPEDASTFEKSFADLPAGAQTEVFRYLAVESGAWRPANDVALREFASTEEGARLLEEWGRGAARNLGIVRGRLALMLQSMTEPDRSAATAWFDGLPTGQARAVLKSLAGAR